MNDESGSTGGSGVGRSESRPVYGQATGRGRVVVVGPCASGKSTLVRGLRALGYQAVVCGQEHSEIPTLWRRSDPTVLVALDVDLATIRRRRGAGWSEASFDRQRARLADARAAAQIVLDVSGLSEAAVLARVVRALELAGLQLGRMPMLHDAGRSD